jgi:hypothetical protein
VLLSLLLMLACDPAPPPLPPLSDRSEPEQLAALESALLADPASALALCTEVTAPGAKDRCARLKKRPHLWQPRPEPARDLPSPHTAAAPLTEPCGGHPQPRACWSRFAYGRAAAGDMGAAASACVSITEPRWREECMFLSGEAAVERHLASGYADGLSLCALSGRFQADCLAHSVSLLAEAAPSSPDGDWRPTIEAADTIEASWASIDPKQGARWREQLWAEALLFAYDRAETLSGSPLDVLPADAHPHLTAAVAWRMLSLPPPAQQDLDGWSAALGEVLKTRAPVTMSRRPRRALTTIPALDPPAAGPGVISWLGLSRRPVSDDPATDWRLCVLEAAARRPGGSALVEDGRDDPSPTVRASAQRLLAAIGASPSLQ